MYENPYYRPYQENNELEHYGVLGMKWGVRRYQNSDGTLTEAGKKRLEDYKFREMNRVSAQQASYQKAVDRRKTRREKTGAIQKPEQAAREKKRLEEFKKELSAIKYMNYSDMEKELKIGHDDNAVNAFITAAMGPAAGLAMASIRAATRTDPYTQIRKLRMEIYDELNKK